MRLVIKITIFFVFVSSIVFVLGGFIAYHVMNREMQFEQQWYLGERMPSIVSYLERRQPESNVIRDKMIIMPLIDTVAEMGPVYSDTMVMHTTLQRMEPHMKLEAVKNINGRSYRIILYDLVVESDDIEDVVKESMLIIFSLLLGLMLVLGFIGFYFVFKPFRGILSALQNFSLQHVKPISLPDSSTTEFKTLNKFITEMTEKVRRDYLSLKEFSENASHEMQTPLAIAQGKLEILSGSDDLDEEQMELINSARNALQRVSKLGRSLSLLTKIENKEFSREQNVDLSAIIKQLLFEFKELIDLKSLNLKTIIEDGVLVQGNEALLEILITNLISNAIRHNMEDGYINVTLTSQSLIVENSGLPLKHQPEEYFKRFKKDNNDPVSSGLGLSIARKICEEMGFLMNYEQQEQVHKITILINK